MGELGDLIKLYYEICPYLYKTIIKYEAMWLLDLFFNQVISTPPIGSNFNS